MTAQQAKDSLIAGNERFYSGRPQIKDTGPERLRQLCEEGQKPFAAIVCCSDSRVPPEIVFDQGLGDLFVIRTAGNVLDDIGMGSVEYGAHHLHIPLIVVLGHEGCGAVKAAVDGGDIGGCLRCVTDAVGASAPAAGGDPYEACADASIRATAEKIRQNGVIAGLLAGGQTAVVGAKYHMLTGRVAFAADGGGA